VFRALILAGGKSSRMGEDKAALRTGDITLLEHAVRLLESCDPDEILISGEVAGHEGIPDILKACGPLGGIHAALHHLADRHSLDGNPLLTIPVDMPLLTSHCLQKMLQEAEGAAACWYKGEVFPCLFRADQALLDYLDGLFSESHELGGRRSMKSLLRFADYREIEHGGIPEQVFRNINYPEDWQRYLSDHS